MLGVIGIGVSGEVGLEIDRYLLPEDAGGAHFGPGELIFLSFTWFDVVSSDGEGMVAE